MHGYTIHKILKSQSQRRLQQARAPAPDLTSQRFGPFAV